MEAEARGLLKAQLERVVVETSALGINLQEAKKAYSIRASQLVDGSRDPAPAEAAARRSPQQACPISVQCHFTSGPRHENGVLFVWVMPKVLVLGTCD